MTTALLVISVSSRVPELNDLLASIKALPELDALDVHLMFQDTHGLAGMIRHRDRYASVHVEGRMLGCHAARVRLLKKVRADAYVNLDDDMVLTEHTHYAPAIKKAMEPETGFVLTNWARTRALMDAKVPKMRHEFKRQVMVYQGGGMAYRDEVADLMRELPEAPQTYDHTWPLTAYVNGLTNYRYMGSLAVHSIGRPGGMRQFMDSIPVSLSMTEFFRTRPVVNPVTQGRSVCIPLDKDLTEAAHAAHREAAKARGYRRV